MLLPNADGVDTVYAVVKATFAIAAKPEGVRLVPADEPLPENLEFTMVTELFDFGTEIDVEVPPAADVSDMPGFMDPELQTGAVPCMDDVNAAIEAYKAQHGEDAEPSAQDLLDAGLLESVNGVSITWGEDGEGVAIFGEQEQTC